MKILMLFVLVIVSIVGLTKADSFSDAEMERADQRAFLRKLLSGLQHAAGEQDTALAQDDQQAAQEENFQQAMNQKEEVATEQRCYCFPYYRVTPIPGK